MEKDTYGLLTFVCNKTFKHLFRLQLNAISRYLLLERISHWSSRSCLSHVLTACAQAISIFPSDGYLGHFADRGANGLHYIVHHPDVENLQLASIAHYFGLYVFHDWLYNTR